MPSIALVPGDGVGKECVDEALRVLKRVGEIEGLEFKYADFPFGADH